MPTQYSPLILQDRRAIALWLAACVALVAMMVVLGGYTRLSGSGLSITEWKPIHGVIPPLGAGEWEEEFAAYRASPQYIKINSGMSLEEFKRIYWPEYLHRLLGRIIGLTVLAPLIFFALRRSISIRFALRIAFITALGGLQGLVGWLMVESGLSHHPYVSHVRLALHLSIAFAILGLLLWSYLDAREPPPQASLFPKAGKNIPTNLRRRLNLWFFLLCLQIIYGALVAGMHAGLIYNTYPTMNGQWIPDGLLRLDPLPRNAVENVTFVQFTHRWLAVLVVVVFLLWWQAARRHGAHLSRLCTAIAAAIILQITLGILTLLHMVPLTLALLHQALAMVLFGLAVVLLYRVYAPQYVKEVVWRH